MSTAIGYSMMGAVSASTMIGESVAIRRLRDVIAKVARTRLSVLVEGPTGAGKELVAAAIHAESGRTGAFVPFNVCAISESMFEDALFGHVRGAFTGAHQDVSGYLRDAHGGTVFLDEISGLPPLHQPKLLRALETGMFRPVGARRDAYSDFRVVAASNDKIDEMVAASRFRADLAHRIGAVRLRVPSLAERVDDLPLLVRHFLTSIGSATHVRDATLALLASHDWPGNVRELKHVVDCAAALGEGRLTLDAVRQAIGRPARGRSALDDALALERSHLLELLEAHAWNTVPVARAVGVHRATLYRRMKKLGIPLRGAASAIVGSSRRRASSVPDVIRLLDASPIRGTSAVIDEPRP